jgi:amidohydrolase
MGPELVATISPPVSAVRERLSALRRDLHQHPELGFQEVRTASLIAARLAELGYTVRTGLGKTGVTGRLAGGRPGPTILIRSEIDALPLQEAVAVPWRSRTPGVMHACGHDANTAIVLTAAEVWARERASLPGTMVLAFQPAEELLEGAAAMLADGALDGVDATAAFAVHLNNEAPVGTVTLRSGPVTASADRLAIVVTGQGGHGAFPHLARDPIVATAHLITALQTLVSRETPPAHSAVVSITTLKAGTAFNIIPDTVEMTGTLRCSHGELRERLLASLHRMAEGTAAALGCQARIDHRLLTPAVVNDPALTRLAWDVAAGIVGDPQVVELERQTGADDVAFFWERVPGCYMLVGSAKTDGTPVGQHHNASFDIDEGALAIGLELLLGVVARTHGTTRAAPRPA